MDGAFCLTQRRIVTVNDARFLLNARTVVLQIFQYQNFVLFWGQFILFLDVRMKH